MNKIMQYIYGAKLKDKDILLKSSSGGMFSILSDQILDCEGVIVCSSYNYENHSMEFYLTTNKTERDNSRGSKYIQSKPGNIFKEVECWLRENPDKELMFIGTACQVHGIKQFLQFKGLLDNVLLVDLICHGNSSPRIWKDYVSMLESRYGKVSYVTFKDKRNGWEKPTAYVITEKGEYEIVDYTRLYYSNHIIRPSCYECPYSSFERVSDITIGDFWGVEKSMPEFYDKNGVSLVLVNTLKGSEFFEKCKPCIDFIESSREKSIQPSLKKPTDRSDGRESFWDDYKKKGLKYILLHYSREAIMEKIEFVLKYSWIK